LHLLKWEFFAIRRKGGAHFRALATYSTSAALRRWEPASDRLDWEAPFFFSGVYQAWRNARRSRVG
jgi:hypothetical protein